MAAPLTALLRGAPRKLSWTAEAEGAFIQLKRLFTSAPILSHPDPSLPFVVEVDASESGVRAVLSQHDGNPAKLHPCAFFSRKLSPAERNYDVGNRELLAMKLAFGEWRHWLEGSKHPFTVFTDHRNLEYLHTAKRLNTRQARWALYFTRFDFTLTYRPGSKNTKADALSRQFDAPLSPPTKEYILPRASLVVPVRWDIEETIHQAQTSDPTPTACPPSKVYVPESVRSRLLSMVHASLTSGIRRTRSLLEGTYWWPSLATDVTRFVSACTVCAQAKTPRQLPAGLLEQLPIPHRPWSHIAVDFVTDLPKSQGNTTVLVVIDRLSKSCRLHPLPQLPTAMETAEALFH